MRTNQEKLGTMLDKVSRIEKTAGKLSTALGLSRTFVPVLEEAAGLAMSDLAIFVVTEFTSLAGKMGRYYALRDGYSQQVNQTTSWHNPVCFCWHYCEVKTLEVAM
ncbi:Glycine-tRNA synthetase heterodimeric protein [Dioscorea alata]|uniref:Glycine-tRNA synthetase heterodimeric protein n=1 Tax=Dioscorea alata TaxID=55571 RepID=A0ACB7TR46_DIOAL|nr:Glycine-tRNA synthetase heterodimeric protein [Dioscorea alata]